MYTQYWNLYAKKVTTAETLLLTSALVWNSNYIKKKYLTRLK